MIGEFALGPKEWEGKMRNAHEDGKCLENNDINVTMRFLPQTAMLRMGELVPTHSVDIAFIEAFSGIDGDWWDRSAF